MGLHRSPCPAAEPLQPLGESALSTGSESGGTSAACRGGRVESSGPCGRGFFLPVPCPCCASLTSALCLSLASPLSPSASPFSHLSLRCCSSASPAPYKHRLLAFCFSASFRHCLSFPRPPVPYTLSSAPLFPDPCLRDLAVLSPSGSARHLLVVVLLHCETGCWVLVLQLSSLVTPPGASSDIWALPGALPPFPSSQRAVCKPPVWAGLPGLGAVLPGGAGFL